MLLRRAESVADSDAEQLVRLVEQHQAAAATGQRTSILLLTTCRGLANRAVVGLIDKTGPAAHTKPLSSTPERIPGLVADPRPRRPNGRHTMSPAALQSFVQYRWPGNITELVDTLTALVSQVHASVIERDIFRDTCSKPATSSSHTDRGRRARRHHQSPRRRRRKQVRSSRSAGHWPHDAVSTASSAGAGRRRRFAVSRLSPLPRR